MVNISTAERFPPPGSPGTPMQVNELSKPQYWMVGPGSYAEKELPVGYSTCMKVVGREAYCPSAPNDSLGPDVGPAKYDFENYDRFYETRRTEQGNRQRKAVEDQTDKFPVPKYEQDRMELVSGRTPLNGFKKADRQAWDKTPVCISLEPRFGPLPGMEPSALTDERRKETKRILEKRVQLKDQQQRPHSAQEKRPSIAQQQQRPHSAFLKRGSGKHASTHGVDSACKYKTFDGRIKTMLIPKQRRDSIPSQTADPEERPATAPLKRTASLPVGATEVFKKAAVVERPTVSTASLKRTCCGLSPPTAVFKRTASLKRTEALSPGGSTVSTSLRRTASLSPEATAAFKRTASMKRIEALSPGGSPVPTAALQRTASMKRTASLSPGSTEVFKRTASIWGTEALSPGATAVLKSTASLPRSVLQRTTSCVGKKDKTPTLVLKRTVSLDTGTERAGVQPQTSAQILEGRREMMAGLRERHAQQRAAKRNMVYGSVYEQINDNKTESAPPKVNGAESEAPVIDPKELGPRARKQAGLDRYGQKLEFEAGVYNYDVTSMAYRLEHSGTNPYKCTFDSTLSRSPRTNPICAQPETQKASNTHLGPGYYNI